MTRTVNGTKWTYSEDEGAWWNEDESLCITRSERNKNVWIRWDGVDYQGGEEFKTMKKAMV